MHRRPDLWGPDGVSHSFARFVSFVDRSGLDTNSTAAEFDPDRFLDERVGKYLTPNPFIFLPFNAGPRICPGQQVGCSSKSLSLIDLLIRFHHAQFAYNEISFMLIRLLQQTTEMKLVQAQANPAAVPPPGWAESRFTNGKDCVFVRSHLTAHVEVSSLVSCALTRYGH